MIRLREVIWLLAPLLLAGCAQDLDTTYGSRQSLLGGETSINGLGVLAEMFDRAGHRVSSVERLTPRLGRSADVIVWFPEDFVPPSPAAVAWFEEWLGDQDGRTLIFVTRNYDAEPHYWAKVKSLATTAEQPRVNARQMAAQAVFATRRATPPPQQQQPEDWSWLTMDRSATLAPRSVRSVMGDPNWVRGVDATQLAIELYGRIQPQSVVDEVLLQSRNDVIAFRTKYGGEYRGRGSQVIVVANGSFLLNMPLVNREHRKLAGSLIREVGDNKAVYFLEAGGSPQVLSTDPPPPKLMVATRYFDVPRIQNLLWHLSALTLIVCFALFAIFGRPRQETKTFTSDFGQHVEALGDLLQKTRDEDYARQRLTQYQQLTRGDYGRGGRTTRIM